MTNRLTVPLFSITLILSAFLLFSVQPFFARMILPLLGGSPSVWNTAMVFFQAMLLAGYAYAHGSSRFLGIRAQAILHGVLLVIFASFLPILLPMGLNPAEHAYPALWQLGIMAMVVGAPFFIIAASAPMFQRWFSASDHKDAANPYFLYAASNIGSMAALLSYPVLVEPLMTLKLQSLAWSGGYAVLAALAMLCALTVWKNAARTTVKAREHLEPIPLRTKLLWVMLSFIPSSLLLGVTTYVTTDIASVPLLWIVPLALYLGTFIIVFARRPVFTLRDCVAMFTVMMIVASFIISVTLFNRLTVIFVVHFFLFFFAALLCHKYLAEKRPVSGHLTSFYMYMSLGGVLGGMFNALLAPLVFKVPMEYTLILCMTLFVRALIMQDNYPLRKPTSPIAIVKSPLLWSAIIVVVATFLSWEKNTALYYYIAAGLAEIGLIILWRKPVSFAVLGTLILMLHSPLMDHLKSRPLLTERNFFGVLQVEEAVNDKMRLFMHGTTLHGAQPKQEEQRLIQMTYYNPAGPLGDAFRLLEDNSAAQKIGGIGLGVGTIACYTKPGRSFDFYEIDPAVARIAQDQTLFTYLSDCGSPYQIVIGDGRLTLESAPDGAYDLLLIDAFSSDNIPMHLLTLEAFQTYMRKVKADGIIIFNVSNRFIDLDPQLAALSQASKVPALAKYGSGGPATPEGDIRYTSSKYILFTPDPNKLIRLRMVDGWEPPAGEPDFRLWTDDYANILTSLKALRR